ncbi:hypothetical protein [Endozoicomonas sp. SESOKO3]|nr:hypothetical protein [Endozoicomonas sp. SESOKO3]
MTKNSEDRELRLLHDRSAFSTFSILDEKPLSHAELQKRASGLIA